MSANELWSKIKVFNLIKADPSIPAALLQIESCVRIELAYSSMLWERLISVMKVGEHFISGESATLR